ncbi:hypothetical protein [Burkholderia catarinensis]|uniref:hypothetical protein n=1 Tax=Burkholderia catarinensis TaxID=1108140 RepID=UPI00090FC91D|nr:hypothetical protein [Burkholderia catarinensis]KAG8148786.1 hypothetical protein BFF94_035935 [Burkholderia catarinensis]
MRTVLLSNERYTLELSPYSADTALVTRLTQFLAPYFSHPASPGGAASEIDLRLALHEPAAFKAEWIARCTTPSTIRETTAPGFTLRVRTARETGILYAWDPELRVGYRIQPARRKVDFYGASNAFIHLIELVRYYGLLVEQSKGAAIMHASAVATRVGGDIIAIGGVKGAGKTTTMLDLVASGDYLYFSGDKLLLDVVDGRIRARGWPDYPHVGVGTLRSHPELAEQLGLAGIAADPAFADTDKRLCPPEAMRRALASSGTGTGWLTSVCLPDVSAPGSFRIDSLAPDEIALALRAPGLFEWPHRFITSTWHGLPAAAASVDFTDSIPDNLAEALAGIVWQSRLGLPRLSVLS